MWNLTNIGKNSLKRKPYDVVVFSARRGEAINAGTLIQCRISPHCDIVVRRYAVELTKRTQLECSCSFFVCIYRPRRTSDRSSAVPHSNRAKGAASAKWYSDRMKQTPSVFASSDDDASDSRAATKCDNNLRGIDTSAATKLPPSNVSSSDKPIFETMMKFDAIRRESQAAREENARRFLLRTQRRVKQQRQKSAVKTCLERLLSAVSNEAAAENEAGGNTVATSLPSVDESSAEVLDDVAASATSDDVTDGSYNRRQACVRQEHCKEATSGVGLKCRYDNEVAMRTSSEAIQSAAAAAAVSRCDKTRPRRCVDTGVSSPKVPTMVAEVHCPLTVNELLGTFSKIRQTSLEAQQKNYRSLEHKLKSSSVTSKTSLDTVTSQ